MIDWDIAHEINKKPREEWTIDDWKQWALIHQEMAETYQPEILRLMKENVRLSIQIKKYEAFIRKRMGLPKRVKTKGLLSAPRGAPMKDNKLIKDFVIRMRHKKYTWVEIGQFINSFNLESGTKYPTSERHLRAISSEKPAE